MQNNFLFDGIAGLICGITSLIFTLSGQSDGQISRRSNTRRKYFFPIIRNLRFHTAWPELGSQASWRCGLMRVEILRQQDPLATSVIGLIPEVISSKGDVDDGMSEVRGGTEVVGAGFDNG